MVAAVGPPASSGNVLETRITWSHPRSPNPRKGFSIALSIFRLLMSSRWRVNVVKVFMAVSSGLGYMLPSNGGIALASLQEGRTLKEEEIVDCSMQT